MIAEWIAAGAAFGIKAFFNFRARKLGFSKPR